MPPMRMKSPNGAKAGSVARRALLSMALIAALPAAALAQGQPDPVVVDRTFMAVSFDKSGEPTFDFTTRVAMVPDRNCFQWAVQLDMAEVSVDVVEVLELPATAGRWGTDTSALSADGTSAKTERSLRPDEFGWIGGQWCFAPNDPLGPHRITVTSGDWLHEVFDFEVVAP